MENEVRKRERERKWESVWEREGEGDKTEFGK